MAHRDTTLRPWLLWLLLIPLALVTALWAVPKLVHPVQAEDKDEEVKPAPVTLTPADLYVVKSESVPETIQVTGTLQPLPGKHATISAELPGRLLDLTIKPGDTAMAGQVVARVMRTDLDAAIQKADADVRAAQEHVAELENQRPLQSAQLDAQEQQAIQAREQAKAQLAQLRAGSREEEKQRARAQLASAQADLDRLKKGPRPQEIRQAEAALSEADAAVTLAEKEHERVARLVKVGVSAKKDQERADADLAQAKARQASANQALSTLREGTRKEEIDAQQAKVNDAQAALDLVMKGPRPQEIEAAQAAVGQAEAKLREVAAGRKQAAILTRQIDAAKQALDAARATAKAARATLRQADVRSPIGGTVSKVTPAPGEVVQAGAPIAEIESQDALRVLLAIPAAHQSHLRPGDPVTITVPDQPEVRHSGTVRVIDPTVHPETGTVTAEVWFPNSDHRLRAGTIATAELQLGRGGAHPVIPSQAVFALAGEQHVYRLDDDGKIHDTKITLGSEKDGKVEVLSGPKSGDRILRDGSRSIADGTQYEGVPGAKPIEKEKEAGEKEGGDKEKETGEKEGGDKEKKPAAATDKD